MSLEPSIRIAPKISNEQRQRDFELHTDRRDRIIKEIGNDTLGSFEMWAFRAKTPMIYDFESHIYLGMRSFN